MPPLVPEANPVPPIGNRRLPVALAIGMLVRLAAEPEEGVKGSAVDDECACGADVDSEGCGLHRFPGVAWQGGGEGTSGFGAGDVGRR